MHPINSYPLHFKTYSDQISDQPKHVAFAEKLLREIKHHQNWNINEATIFLLQNCYDSKNLFNEEDLEWIISCVGSTFCFPETEIHPFVRLVKLIYDKELNFDDAILLLHVIGMTCSNIDFGDKNTGFSIKINHQSEDDLKISLGYEYCYLHISLIPSHDLRLFALLEPIEYFFNAFQNFFESYVLSCKNLYLLNQNLPHFQNNKIFQECVFSLLTDSNPIKAMVGLILYNSIHSQFINSLLYAYTTPAIINILSSNLPKDWRDTLINFISHYKLKQFEDFSISLKLNPCIWSDKKSELTHHFINNLLKNDDLAIIAKLLYLDLINNESTIELNNDYDFSELIFKHSRFPYNLEIKILKKHAAREQLSLEMLANTLIKFGGSLLSNRQHHRHKNESIELLFSLTYYVLINKKTHPLSTLPETTQLNFQRVILKYCHYLHQRNEPLKSAIFLELLIQKIATTPSKDFLHNVFKVASKLITSNCECALYLQKIFIQLREMTHSHRITLTSNHIKFYLIVAHTLLTYDHPISEKQLENTRLLPLNDSKNLVDLNCARDLLNDLKAAKLSVENTIKLLNLVSLFPSQFKKWKIHQFIYYHNINLQKKSSDELTAILNNSFFIQSNDLKKFRLKIIRLLSNNQTTKWTSSLLEGVLSVIEKLIRQYDLDDAHHLLKLIKSQNELNLSRFSQNVMHLINRSGPKKNYQLAQYYLPYLLPYASINIKKIIEFNEDETHDEHRK